MCFFKAHGLPLSLSNAHPFSTFRSTPLLGRENRQEQASRNSAFSRPSTISPSTPGPGSVSPTLIFLPGIPVSFLCVVLRSFLHAKAFFRLLPSHHSSWNHSWLCAFSQFSAEVFSKPEFVKSITATLDSLSTSPFPSPSKPVVNAEIEVNFESISPLEGVLPGMVTCHRRAWWACTSLAFLVFVFLRVWVYVQPYAAFLFSLSRTLGWHDHHLLLDRISGLKQWFALLLPTPQGDYGTQWPYQKTADCSQVCRKRKGGDFSFCFSERTLGK